MVCDVSHSLRWSGVRTNLHPEVEWVGVPFSTWVADQLRHHAATHSALGFAQQLLADAELANAEPPTVAESLAALERMERSSPW